MSETALVMLCLGGLLVIAGVGLALRYRSTGRAQGRSGRWWAAVVLAGMGTVVALAPLISLFLVSRL